VRVKLALRNALESEAEFVEAEDADAQLLTLLRKPSSRPPTPAKQDQEEQRKTSGNRKPGKRAPGRDSTGTTVGAEKRGDLAEEEQAAG